MAVSSAEERTVAGLMFDFRLFRLPGAGLETRRPRRRGSRSSSWRPEERRLRLPSGVGWRWGGEGGGGGGDFVGGDFGGEDAELGDDVAGGEVAEESLVGLGLVVRAFDENAFE